MAVDLGAVVEPGRETAERRCPPGAESRARGRRRCQGAEIVRYGRHTGRPEQGREVAVHVNLFLSEEAG
ncbi:hypothetical protein Ade02nite_47630 [Paractinoplanes deccanensis]|uniref:Uncharacterized protein n=1 Tax=Paractinoplanes deccanensis TaxID=113561 RepID=A0ABQ3Y805_9ACTN|nr:hypothetical protein [Actinoplanes deccanensis]GID76122.1 hypothetical protein Ade02nite_47630 [Actinoplanes deccanensis]